MTDPLDAYEAFERDVLRPLFRQRRTEEACDRFEAWLETETDPLVRSSAMIHLKSFRHEQGRIEESHAWVVRATEEQPENPSAWNSRAPWHLYYCWNWPPSTAELAEGLEYSDRALALACRTDRWVRHVLFDRGRIANAAGRYDVIEAVMRALIEDAPKSREIDTPMIETDFLDGLPPGAIDPELRARFFAAMRSAVRHRPQMRDDLGDAGP